jgi:hypothetical protein
MDIGDIEIEAGLAITIPPRKMRVLLTQRTPDSMSRSLGVEGAFPTKLLDGAARRWFAQLSLSARRDRMVQPY